MLVADQSSGGCKGEVCKSGDTYRFSCGLVYWYTDQSRWRPGGNWFQDFWFFVGPGWMVCIVYIDPGNY